MDLLVYATYSDIYKKDITFDDFVKTLKSFNRIFLLGILIKVDSILYKGGFIDISQQEFFIKRFFQQGNQDFIFEKLNKIGKKTNPAVIFSPLQIQNLIRLSIIYCEDNKQQDDKGVEKNIGTLFLMMNEFYDSIIKDHKGFKDTLEYLIRNYLYISSEPLRKKLCRYYQLFVEIPKQLQLSSNQIWGNHFESITGLNIEELMAFGFSFLAYWNQIEFSNLKTFNPFLNKDTYFKDSILPADKQLKGYNIFCENINVYSNKLSNSLKDSVNWQLEFDNQKNKPLFEIPNVGIGTHSNTFLNDKITENIYWTFLDSLPADEKQPFLIQFGEIFENYIFHILKRIFRNKAYKIEYNDKEGGDCIVVIKRHIFIFEVKSGRIIKEVYLTGNKEEMFEQFRLKLVLRQLKQMSKVIDDFEADAFKIDKLSYDMTKKIYPICVNLTKVPQLPPIRQELEKIASEENLLQQNKVQPFQIFDAEELEILEAMLTKRYTPSRFLDFMRQKCGNEYFRSYSFKNFVYEATSFAVEGSESDRIQEIFTKISKRFSEIIFSR
jgi:hypothetical protein